MLGVFAEFETNLRRERQLEGIAKAKAVGIYKGRKPTVDIVRVKALKQEGLGPSAIARTLGIGRASVYRALGAQFRWSAIQTTRATYEHSAQTRHPLCLESCLKRFDMVYLARLGAHPPRIRPGGFDRQAATD
jgi:DNA invertase Pin-like site-specific DNA recombinase